VNDNKNKKVLGRTNRLLILCYDTDKIENDASNNSFFAERAKKVAITTAENVNLL
jgi:hypothetical protein